MPTALVRVPATTYTRGAYIDRWGHRHPSVKVSRAGYTKKTKRRKRRKTPKSKRWYSPKTRTGWTKSAPVQTRRQKVLTAFTGDELAAARSMQSLANVTQDPVTKVEASKDAKYFLQEYKETQDGQG